MADVTNELIYEVLCKLQDEMSGMRQDVRGVREEVGAMRGHMLALQRDVNNIYERLSALDTKVDRIERRPEPADAAP